eukprot:CAMPEP_0168346116 /NCGR_PEP_ID=MMETSP0213-20121227/18047_1 /TAXON_ID=151035 /ORGANISM="Euplotes harpa, Strain FSP1.4" /LENGTH=86 /DNA_ID=CAMNT_0008354641 /DNA_START=1 /DNA_END=258 /DNA_ORIENTATION=-
MLPYFVLGSVFITLAATFYFTHAFEDAEDSVSDSPILDNSEELRLSSRSLQRLSDDSNKPENEHSSLKEQPIKPESITHKFAFSIP